MEIHKTVPIKVWVDIDKGIAHHVRWLNRLKGVRTFASCQGTKNYPPDIMAYVPRRLMPLVKKRFTLGEKGIGWQYLHPKQ